MLFGNSKKATGCVLQFGSNVKAVAAPVAANDNEAIKPEKMITIRKTLAKSGVTIKLRVPVAEYTGVVVSTKIEEDGALFSAIDLVHSDENLTYRLFEEEGNTQVVAEWQNWGKQLALPLYIRGGNGDLIAYSQKVDGLQVSTAAPRRKLVAHTNRRPRFLHRR